MKHIRYISDRILPRALPDQEVKCIFSVDGGIILQESLKASEVKCPTCGGIEGYYNKGWKAWGCCHEDCIANHSYERIMYYYGEKKESPQTKKTVHQYADIKLFGAPQNYCNANMEQCDQSKDRLEYLSKFARSPLGFVLFAGLSGRGKTYAACAVLSTYAKCGGREACFESVTDLYVKWKDCFNSKTSELHILQKLSDKELIVIDDIGVRTPSDGFLEFIYLLLSKREEPKKGTIVTTNLTSKMVYEKLGDAIGSRMCSGKILVFEGKDRRKQFEF